jgi:hypothetical protein
MKQLLYLFLGMIVLSSCVKNNPDPSWLEVNKWTLEENSNSEYPTGEMTHNFSDAWVYIDDELVGVFEVPFKIPILKSGNVNIKIYPAIRNNGISATKKMYPFVELYEVNSTLVQNETLTLNPVTRYKSSVFFWLEDFEDAAIKIQDDPNSQANIFTGNDPSILEWGNFYGLVELTESDSTWVAYTDDMNLPRGQEVYLEIDYHNSNDLVTGVLAISPSGTINNQNIQLNGQEPSSVIWKKIYIDLKEIVSNSDNSAYFKQTFQAILDGGDTSGNIIIDNVKVVHF